jgi:hypothetical protein
MLYHTLAEPDAGHYVEQFVCRLEGELDCATLEESWHRLIARHPVLRSSIHWSDFEARYQIVHRDVDQPLDSRDWRGLSQPEQEEQRIAYLRSDRRRGFDLSQAPLSRLALVRLGETLHELIWSIHHVVVDGWCLSILLHEMLHIYESLRDKKEPVLRPCRPFRDYVAWLSRLTDAHAQDYWTKALEGFTAPTPLGLETTLLFRSGSESEASAELAVKLPIEVGAALESLGRSARVTLSTLIQGAWALLLSRYSGRSDVLFGVTVSGRPPELSGVESMVGNFINVLPLRVAITEDSELIEWLREIQTTMVEQRRFEAIPLSQIQAWSEVPSRVPLFESILIVQNLPFLASLQEHGGRLGVASARYHERTHYPLTVTVVPARELEIKISFDSRRFDTGAMERMLGHVCTVLAAMAANAEQQLGELPLMSQSEEAHLFGQWQKSHGEPGLDQVDLNQLTEMELDSLMAELSAG